MGICKVCKEENKCILHCEKNEYNSWYTVDKNNERKWISDKVRKFWKNIDDYISIINDACEEASPDMIQGYNFEKVFFPCQMSEIFSEIPFSELKNNININFIECKFLSINDFSLLNKAKNIKFYKCTFFKGAEFNNIEFKNQFYFTSCTVHKNINFINVVFKDVVSFIDTTFYEEFNFAHTRFDELVIFDSLKYGILLLMNTFFRKEVNFLLMDIKIDDRETARIIKHSFEQQNNIIEANKFYALEMN